jgi:dTDP-4-dehydrorhamnose reductase
MKVLLIGANGQLGSDIMAVFGSKEIIPLVHDDIEITDFEWSRKVLEEYRPDVLINTAAYHNVPECERNPDKAFLVNSIGLRNLSEICLDHRITLVHISTDYVFDGGKKSPYSESDTPGPLNTYGVSKLAGEYFVRRVEKHYVIRVSSLFGKSGCRAKGGGNFVKSMLHLAKTKDRIQVTSNIICSPTFTRDAASKIKELLVRSHPSGIYHAANGGFCSWYEFALEIFSQAKIKINVESKTEAEVEEGVRRPLYSPLISEKIKPVRDWKDALKAYLKEENVL